MKYGLEYIDGKPRNIHSFSDEETIPNHLTEITESQLDEITKLIEKAVMELE